MAAFILRQQIFKRALPSNTYDSTLPPLCVTSFMNDPNLLAGKSAQEIFFLKVAKGRLRFCFRFSIEILKPDHLSCLKAKRTQNFPKFGQNGPVFGHQCLPFNLSESLTK